MTREREDQKWLHVGGAHSLHSHACLVLNSSYEPINVCSARRALKLVMKGAALVEVPSSHTIRTSKVTIPLPSVIRLVNYRYVPKLNKAVSRKNVMLRDKYTCQYCGRTFTTNKLTLDHVIPRSRGGPSIWENLITCCYACNNKKGDRTPTEAGMKLLSKPRQMNLHAKHKLLSAGHESWAPYLFTT